jgi:transcriptional regulator with XRE-family HTH domain
MLAHQFGVLLRSARTQRRLSRAKLAKLGGVSLRLVAEVEQGIRPNVSLESALKLLRAAGVSIVASAPHCRTVEVRDPAAAEFQRAERAELRRQNWTSRRAHLHASDDSPPPERSAAKRLAVVSEISKQAYAIAAAGIHPATGRSKSRVPNQLLKNKRAAGREKDKDDVRRLEARQRRKSTRASSR